MCRSYQSSPWSTERIAPAPQIHAWMKRFDLNRSGALEREELFALLSHLHPENPPNGKALDLLMEKAPRKPALYTNNPTSLSYPDRVPRGEPLYTHCAHPPHMSCTVHPHSAHPPPMHCICTAPREGDRGAHLLDARAWRFQRARLPREALQGGGHLCRLRARRLRLRAARPWHWRAAHTLKVLMHCKQPTPAQYTMHAHSLYTAHTHTRTLPRRSCTHTQPTQACCSSRIYLPSCRRRAQAPRLAMTR